MADKPVPKRLHGVTDMELAKQLLKKHRDDPAGVICPCCDGLVKAYWRPMNSLMARFLLAMLFASRARFLASGEFPWIEVRYNVLTAPWAGGDYAYLEHWGLIESAKHPEFGKLRSSGQWRLTKAGYNFALNEGPQPHKAHLYHNQVTGWSDKQVDIVDVLGKRFDYRELMAWG